MMKICLLSDTYPPIDGGLAVSVQRNAQNLAAAGHKVHVVTPSESGSPGFHHTETDGSVTVHRLGTQPRLRNTLTDWFELTTTLAEAEAFDLFHGYFIAYAGYIAALTARYQNKVSIVSARGNDIDLMPFDDRRAIFIYKALEWANSVTAVTQDLARKITALSGRTDIHLTQNGVDAAHFTPQPPNSKLQTALKLDDRPVIGFLGEARTKKGLGRLLRIFPQLYQKIPVQMLLVGGVRQKDKAMLDFFQQQHPDLPLRLVPARPNREMPPYYALCDIVVLPSLRDGLPNTLLEAMACGRPVVASAVGGMLDVVSDGLDGILLSLNDDVWVDTLHKLLLNPQAREQLGQTARQTVQAHFTPARELETLLAVYEQTLSR